MLDPSHVPGAAAAPSLQRAVASFVPALVARSSAPATRLEAAVLFVDAVGFTSRVGPLVEAGPQGIERVSALLDAYYAPMLEAVAEHGGDVVRFVGDALLAVFPADERALAEATLASAACARAIQRAPRPTMPDGEGLAARVVVTAGPVVLLREAGTREGHFVLAGAPVEELATWAPRVGPGEVLLAPSAARFASAGISGTAAGEGLRVDDVEPPAPDSGAPPASVAAVEGLGRFVPRPVLERIRSGHLEWLAELRRVTAAFVSVRGLDAARVPEVLGEARAQAERHGVFLKELVLDDKGWTLVALTGVPPYAGADDAGRAVRFAREMIEALAARGLQSGAGVAGGRAFCGGVGSVRRREYAVVGAVVNLASRLSQAASGGVLCDEWTSRPARRQVAFEELPPITLKGFRAPVAVWAAGGDVVAPRAEGELVGREAERALLRGVVEGVGVDHRPAVLVEGEPGMGKSRLAREVLAHAEARGLVCCDTATDAARRSDAYFPWRSVIAGILLTLRTQNAADLRELLGPEDGAFAPLLEPFVRLGLSDNEATATLAGQMRARKTRALCVVLLERLAARCPVFLLLEDAHWADPASWDLLRDVIAARIPALRVVVTSRSDPTQELDALERAGATRCRLTGLTRAATAGLLSASLGVHDIDPVLIDRVYERAAGNPLFAEQLALSLIESRAVRVEGGRCSVAEGVDLRTVALPADVEGAITARLDRLPPATQLVLKVASVLGPAFAGPVLRDIYPHAGDRARIGDELEALCEAQLMERDIDGYHRFRHEVVRDVAYQSMLFEQRRVLHGAAADWYERRHADDLTPYLALLAHHHEHAGRAERAVDYLELASAHTFRIGLPRQSVALGLDGARLLGMELPTDPAAVGARIGQLVGETLQRIGGRAPAELLALPPMKDPATLRTLRLLLEVAPFTFQAGRPDLYALLGLTSLRLALEHGNAAPDVYSTYSVVHRAIHHDAAGGHAWSELARALDEQQGGAARARVAFVHGWFHSHWLRPLRESLDVSRQAAAAGFAVGDVLFGCYNLSAQVVYAAAAGRPLGEVVDLARANLAENGQRVVNAAFHCTHEMQVARALMGATGAPLSLSDEVIDEERDVASICASDFYNQIGYYLVSRVKLHALFGDAPGALGWVEKLGPLQAAVAGQVAEIDLVLYRTVAQLDVGDLEGAREGAAEVARWAEGCRANFGHLAELLAAGVAAAEGRREEALAGFARAATQADAEGFVQHAALAHERAARLDPAAGHTTRAIEAYRRWGAQAKVDALRAASPA